MSGDYSDLLQRLKLSVESGLGPASVRAAQAIDAITALVKERDEANARSESRGKILLRTRDKLVNIKDAVESDDDRAFFGSTNDADEFVEIVNALDDFKFDRMIREGKEDTPLKDARSRAEAAEAEVVRLRAILNAAEKDCHKARFALQTIGESTVPDQPASSGLSELEHVQHHHTQLRRLAIMTLQPEAIGIYEAPRRDADEIRVRGVGRDLFEPRSIRVALTERPTDDEIRSMHDWMRGWKL